MSDLLLKMPLVYEPLKKNRFVLRFPADLGIQEWTLVSAKRPSINQNPVEIPFLNTSTWVVGRYVWEDVTVTFDVDGGTPAPEAQTIPYGGYAEKPDPGNPRHTDPDRRSRDRGTLRTGDPGLHFYGKRTSELTGHWCPSPV